MLFAQALGKELPPLPISKLGPSGADSQVGGFVYVLCTLWVLPMNSPVRLGVSPAMSIPTVIFSVRGFEALFPLAGTLGCVICLTPQLLLLVYPHVIVGPPSPPAAAFPHVLSALAAHPCPSYRSG